MKNKTFLTVLEAVLPFLSLILVWLFNSWAIASSFKTLLNLLSLALFAFLAIFWAWVIHAIGWEKFQFVTAAAVALILAFSLFYAWFSGTADAVTLYVLQYSDYILIWIFVIIGCELSQYLAAKNGSR